MEIEIECPCPEPTPTPTSTVCQCCQQTQQSLQQQINLLTTLHRDIRFRSGQVLPNERNEYGQWINTMRETVIQRDRYYPQYQQDWGGSGGGSSNALDPITGTTTDVFVTVLDRAVNGIWMLGIRNTGGQTIAYRVTSTSFNGITVVGATANIGVGGSDNSFRDDQVVGAAVPPMTNILVDVRSTFVGFPTTFDIRFAAL